MGEWKENRVWGYGVDVWVNGDKFEGDASITVRKVAVGSSKF